MEENSHVPPPSAESCMQENSHIPPPLQGNGSSDEEDVVLDDVPDDDEYDTDDSFIDDAELDDYFQVDNSAIKHDGFFVNCGKLERIEPSISANQQPKKRRRKDLDKGQGGLNDGRNPSKHVKLGDKGRKTSSIEKKIVSQSNRVAVPNAQGSKITLDPSGMSNGDPIGPDKDADQQRTGVLPLKIYNNKQKEGSELQDTAIQRSIDKISYENRPQSGKPLTNADESDQSMQQKEKAALAERFDLNVPASKDSLQTYAPHKMFSKAMEEQGCQLFLQKLEERKLEDIQMIFSELKDYICKLMFNRFGSDVILKLFEVCNEEQKNQLFSSVTADARLLLSVCLDSQGSDTMQKFLGFPMEQQQINRIMRFFGSLVVPLANHPSGSQVILQCFKIFPVPAKETKPILDTITQFWLELAVDKNGSNLLKILLSEHGSGVGGVRSIVESILVRTNLYLLSRDEFGSSLIQHLIGLLKPNQLQNLVYDMLGICVLLSGYKYGRNVVKKLIGAYKAKYASQIISTMVNDNELLVALSDTGFSFLRSLKTYAKGTDRKVLNDLVDQYAQQLKKKNFRNLKVMAHMGLSVKQEKGDQLQKIKQEVEDMIKLQSVYMQSKVEQQNASLDDFQEAGRGDRETLKRKYSMDSALENKICDIYDLCVERLEEESGPPVRRLYEELAKLWPSGVMDTEGVKRAISREKDRRRALNNRRKDQEKSKKTKVLTPKTEDTTRGEGTNISQISYLQQKLSIDSRDHSATLTSKSNLVTPSQAQQLSYSDPGPKDITYRRGMHGKFRSIA